MYGERIKYFRKQKGLSQAAVASKLNIEPAAYSKIETNRTRLATDVLENIATILDISPLAIMKQDSDTLNFNDSASNHHETVNSWINAETVFNYQKELIDKFISSKENEIELLKKVIENLQKLLAQQSHLVEKLSEKK